MQREIVSSVRLAALPPAFGTRALSPQATEYAFAYIQVPQDVSMHIMHTVCTVLYWSNCVRTELLLHMSPPAV